ncbi:hypothetical protein [Amycolatopsis anabasis]|uniref:hypothetical protein n=1 Tax=Amycolatopsis anabasis TaxID=1840409 RepID=UPI00131AF3C0|nr:hypothetical protein [Amycolatopsis anabasis]
MDDLYTIEWTGHRDTGARPRIRGEDLTALDVLSLMVFDQNPPAMLVRDATGTQVAVATIVRAARTQASTPATRRQWTRCMGRALVEQLLLHADTDGAITDHDWWRTGLWWSATVGPGDIDADVLDDFRRRGVPDNPRDRQRGIRLLTAAAIGFPVPPPGARWLATTATIPARPAP